MRGFLSGLALLTLLVAGAVVSPAVARDRPGTPNNLVIRDCQEAGSPPSFCGVFSDNATENVKIEFELTEDNHPAAPGPMLGCPTHGRGETHVPRCMINLFNGEGDGEFEMRGLRFGATYCIRLRARRISDQVVSQLWTAPACFRTAPQPPFPAAPNIQTAYQGGIWSGGQKPKPGYVRIYVATDRYTNAYLTLNGQGYYPQADLNKWIYTVNPSDDLLTITVCMVNASGRNCGTKVISITNQSDVSVNGKRIVVTGAPRH